MIWEEVEEKYGKELADKMSKSRMLKGMCAGRRQNGYS